MPTIPTSLEPSGVQSSKGYSTYYRGEATLNPIRPVKDLKPLRKTIIERFHDDGKVALF